MAFRLFSKTSLLRLFVWFKQNRGAFLRLFFCWFIGWIAYQSMDHTQFDSRFQFRGLQKFKTSTVLVVLSASDLDPYFSKKLPEATFSESTELTDSYYWNRTLWINLMTKVLEQKPNKVGISFYFGDNLGPVSLTSEEKKLLQDPRLLWSATISNSERVLWPLTADFNIGNVGTTEIYRDRDGIVRRILPTLNETTHLVSMLASQSHYQKQHEGFVINFSGPREQIQTIRARDLMTGEIPKDFLKGKTVIIGADDSEQTLYLTPTGSMTKAEIMSQAVQTLNEDRVIKEIPALAFSLLLFLLLWLIVWIIKELPQGLALFCITWVLLFYTVGSLALFDIVYFWIPLAPVWIMTAFTWLVYASYQSQLIEKRNLELEQENKYNQEVEQLKTNFISLISHDLKTPIAKIQAVADRLLVENADIETFKDLKALRSYSDELFNYIQSILKISQVESKDFKLRPEIVDFNELIQSAVDQVTPLAQEKQIEIKTDLEPLFSIECDPILIKEVIMNLIENAIKYSPSSTSIRIKSNEQADRVFFEIQDEGPGIAPENIEKVWEKFTRGPGEDHRSKGTGLGLYLVKYFIELHGGEVSLKSQVGKGTKIKFSLLTEF